MMFYNSISHVGHGCLTRGGHLLRDVDKWVYTHIDTCSIPVFVDHFHLEYTSMKYCNLIGHARGPYFRSATGIGAWILLYPQGWDGRLYYIPRIAPWILLCPKDMAATCCCTWQRLGTYFTHGNRQSKGSC